VREVPQFCGSYGGYGLLLRSPDRNPEPFPCVLEELPHRMDQRHEWYPLSGGDASLAVGLNVAFSSPSESAASGTFPLLAVISLSRNDGWDVRSF
jgi:hypothetical protein